MVNNGINAIISAKGFPEEFQKNIFKSEDKPVISCAIEAVLKSKCISRVIMCTDDEEIAGISKEAGAEVPFLRDMNADDHSAISLATVRTLHQMKEVSRKKPDIVVQLMANCPLRRTEDINDALENFIAAKNNFQIISFKYGWMKPCGRTSGT